MGVNILILTLICRQNNRFHINHDDQLLKPFTKKYVKKTQHFSIKQTCIKNNSRKLISTNSHMKPSSEHTGFLSVTLLCNGKKTCGFRSVKKPVGSDDDMKQTKHWIQTTLQAQRKTENACHLRNPQRFLGKVLCLSFLKIKCST